MKIAFVYDTVYPWVTGGAERRIYEIGKRLANKGHDVHIYSLGFWMKDPKYKNQKVIKYENMTYHSTSDAMDLYTKDNKRSIKEALKFAYSILPINFKDYDIVDVQGFPYFSCYTSFMKKKNSKLIITLHEVWNDYWYEYMGSIGFFGKIVEKGIMHLTDNMICVSDTTFENMKQIKQPENSVIIENGVNFKEINEVRKSDNECDIIYAGRLIYEKHVDLLIKAVSISKKTHPDIKCMIIGDGPMKDDLISLAEKLDVLDNIEFKGFCEDQKELYSYIKSSKIFILPSTREGFGIVVIEANACGVPVITIDAPMNAATALINDLNGLVIEDDADKLASSICYVLDNKTFSSDECISYAKKFDWNVISDKTEKYYDTIRK